MKPTTLSICIFLIASQTCSAQATNPSACPNNICKIIAAGHAIDLRFRDFVDFRSRLISFYAPSYSAVWLEDGKVTPKALAMIEILKAADKKGLKPEDYNADLWDEQVAHLDRSEFDVALTVSLMRYLADLHFGKANPGFFHLDAKTRDFEIPHFLRHKLLAAEDPTALIAAEVEPPFPIYKRTEKALADYLVLAAQPDIMLSNLKATVRPGQRYTEASLLVKRLRQVGDIAPDQAIPEEINSYTPPLVQAVKHFQKRHGIEPDGLLGKATLEQINTPLAQRVEQLRLSLERWRWLPHSFSHLPIVVNIPEFRLRTFNSSFESDLEMKVVVGSSYENETPVFSANLGYITFRPYWNMPRSILENEVLDKLPDHRNYLAENRYELLNVADKVIPTPHGLTDAMIKGLRDGKYRLRQMPGPNCALGLIRFGIPNEHNVYLHDTPSRDLFAKARRDFSHGCVRVEHPVQLAIWSLSETDAWTEAKIRAAMNGNKTFQVDLKNPIPVLLVYATAIVFEDGDVHFTPDIYNQDALLASRMGQGYPSRASEDSN